jgi:type IV pilus assembly protein PilW
MKLTVPRRYQQKGLSLIELMVAMLIGTFLMLGITEIFINNQKSYLFQQSQVGNQENGRFTMAVLNQELAKAGYRSLPIDPIPASNGVVTGCVFAAGASVAAISTTSLCIQYQAASRADTGCLGAALSSANQNLIVRPYAQSNPIIVEKITLDTTTNSLICTTIAGAQPLVTGVSDIRFDYGAGSDRNLTTFGTSPTLTVNAVRYTALLQSVSGAKVTDSSAVPKALTEWNSRYGTTLNDTTRLYQIVQSTVMLRNQLP